MDKYIHYFAYHVGFGYYLLFWINTVYFSRLIHVVFCTGYIENQISSCRCERYSLGFLEVLLGLEGLLLPDNETIVSGKGLLLYMHISNYTEL